MAGRFSLRRLPAPDLVPESDSAAAAVAEAAPVVVAEPPPQPAAPAPLPAAPAVATVEAPAGSRTPAAAASARKAAPAEADALFQELVSEGDAAMIKGDIAAARLFYQSAAAKGNAAAALRLGNSYNPAFLARLGVLGMRGDAAAAATWYRRARELGDPDADRALLSLEQ